MHGYPAVLALISISVLGDLIGGGLAEFIRVSYRTMSLMLHFSAGVILAVIGVELMPHAVEVHLPWQTVSAFVAGSLLFMLYDRASRHTEEETGNEPAKSGAWGVFAAVCVDLFTDGIMIGAGATVHWKLAVLLALAQLVIDVPTGFATVASFRRHSVPRPKRLAALAGFYLPVLAGSLLGYWGLKGQSLTARMAVLACTGGMLLSIVIEDMVQEAHRDGESRWAAPALVLGFGLFSLLTTCL